MIQIKSLNEQNILDVCELKINQDDFIKLWRKL